MMNKRALIIDALNLYYRNFIVDPSLSANGQPIGGLKGFLKSLQKLMRDTNPDKVIICWDGPGGSQKRKSMVKSYKDGRKPIRLNRSIRNLSESEEVENKIWQQTRLVEYLNNTPIIQLMFESIEADDIISAVVQHHTLRGWQKVIVSTDQDFYQLCDDETVIFRPVQKEILNKKRVIEKYGIHPTNFALARAIAGDKSDNLSGVDGVGLPTVSKRLPFLTEEKTSTLEQVLGYCEEKQEESTLKAYTNIVEQFDRVRLNYKMMQLYTPSISVQTRQKIDYSLNNFEYELNKTEIRKMMIQDGFGETSWNDFFANLSNIISKNKQEAG
jgi:DNA polymerase-1